MSRSLPPLTWLRAFEAAARQLNFTAAADELGVTQSAVSQHVRALELRFGLPLFLRKARGLALTDHGRRLLPQVSSALEALAEATSAFDRGAPGPQLTVAASVSIAQWVIAPRLSAFLAGRDGLRIRIMGTIWPDEFRAAAADVEIRFGPDRQVGRNATRLGPDGLVAVAAPDQDTDLHRATLIEAVGMSEGWRDWAAQAGCGRLPDPAIQVDAHGLALDLARQGAGIALTSSYLARPLLAAGALVQVHPAELPSTEGYFLAADPARPEALEFRDWFLGTAGCG